MRKLIFIYLDVFFSPSFPHGVRGNPFKRVVFVWPSQYALRAKKCGNDDMGGMVTGWGAWVRGQSPRYETTSRSSVGFAHDGCCDAVFQICLIGRIISIT